MLHVRQAYMHYVLGVGKCFSPPFRSIGFLSALSLPVNFVRSEKCPLTLTFEADNLRLIENAGSCAASQFDPVQPRRPPLLIATCSTRVLCHVSCLSSPAVHTVCAHVYIYYACFFSWRLARRVAASSVQCKVTKLTCYTLESETT